MSSWLDNGKSVLLEAVKAAYDHIGQEARAGMLDRMSGSIYVSLTNRAELDAREHEKNDTLRELHDRSLEAERLRKENEDLKAEILRLRDPQPKASEPPKRRVVLGTLSPNKSTTSYNTAGPKAQPTNNLRELADKHKRLQIDHKILSRKCDGYKTKLRERTDTIAKWAKYADHLKQKLQESREKPKAERIVSDESEAKYGASSLQCSSPGLVPVKRLGSGLDSGHLSLVSSSLVTTFSHSLLPSSPKRIRSEPPLQNNSLKAADADAHEPASVSTDDYELPSHSGLQGENRPMTVKLEPSSDGPVFVSTREIRKRKRETAGAEPKRLQKIKSEHSNSSGSEAVGEQHYSSAAESIDYEKEVHVPTPRKRKRKVLSRALQAGREFNEGGTPHNKRLDVPRSAMSDSSAPGITSPPSRLDVNYHTAYHSSEVQRNESELLWPPRSPSLRVGSKDWSHYPPGIDVGVMDVAEDGEDGFETVSHLAVKGRLDALLNPPSPYGPMPAKQRGLANKDTSLFKDTNHYNENFKMASRRGLPFKQTKADSAATGTSTMRSKTSNLSPQPSVVRQRGPHKPSILRDDIPRGRPTSRESTPLRKRPTDRLRPEDFKPNPRYNDGLTYIFDEVVRGKEARAALSGCIDPNCCGKTFRHFAEAERKTIGPSVTSRADDIKLLETYLGDEAWRLGTMSPEDKEETWILAKTWELANKFGKHRQRYSRMPTPPGFWNVGFPSTQERAEERRQAQEIRIALVRQRYREAMRPDGAWLFRDEEPN